MVSTGFPIILIAVGAAVLAFGKRLSVMGAAVGALLGVVLLRLLGATDPVLGLIIVVLLAVIGFFAAGFAKGIVNIVLLVIGALGGAAVVLAFLEIFQVPSGLLLWLTAILGGVVGLVLVRRFSDWAMIVLAGLIGGLLITAALPSGCHSCRIASGAHCWLSYWRAAALRIRVDSWPGARRRKRRRRQRQLPQRRPPSKNRRRSPSKNRRRSPSRTGAGQPSKNRRRRPLQMSRQRQTRVAHCRHRQANGGSGAVQVSAALAPQSRCGRLRHGWKQMAATLRKCHHGLCQAFDRGGRHIVSAARRAHGTTAMLLKGCVDGCGSFLECTGDGYTADRHGACLPEPRQPTVDGPHYGLRRRRHHQRHGLSTRAGAARGGPGQLLPGSGLAAGALTFYLADKWVDRRR